MDDPFEQTGEFDYFYTNPPWGQHCDGESVAVFIQRGMEAIGFQGQGMVVIADDTDPETDWTQQVLFKTQSYAISQNFLVACLMPRVSVYHLYDEHEGTPSCNLVLASLADTKRTFESKHLEAPRRHNFYGRNQHLEYRYVLERSRPDYGKATESEYELEKVEGKR